MSLFLTSIVGCASPRPTIDYAAEAEAERVARGLIQDVIASDFERHPAERLIRQLTEYINRPKDALHPKMDHTDKAKWALGRVYESCNRFDEARAVYNELIDAGSGSALSKMRADALAALALLEIRANQPVTALGLIEESLAIFRERDRFGEPAMVGAMNIAAISNVCLRRYADALRYHNESIQKWPTNLSTYASRGATFLIMGRYAEAHRDLVRSMKYQGGLHNDSLTMAWLAHLRLKGEEAAKKSVEGLIKQMKPAQRAGFRGVILDYLLDEASEEALVRASDSNYPSLTQRNQCVAFYFMGVKRQIVNGAEAARPLFEKSVATGAREDVCYHLARAAIDAMGDQSQGPQ